MKLETPEFDAAHWATGKCLGSGLDKVAFEALYLDEVGQPVKTELVLKHQHYHYDGKGFRDGQTYRELSAHNYLLQNIQEDWARAALPWLAQIVGWWVDGEDLWILQEKVEVFPWDHPRRKEVSPWGKPVSTLADQGGTNCGLHKITGKTVSCDYGLGYDSDMKLMGEAALAYEERK